VEKNQDKAQLLNQFVCIIECAHSQGQVQIAEGLHVTEAPFGRQVVQRCSIRLGPEYGVRHRSTGRRAPSSLVNRAAIGDIRRPLGEFGVAGPNKG
jgi:hypothetical protein